MSNGEYLFKTFGESYNRFDFPYDIIRVTAGHGGEALLIKGSKKNVLLDCGMAYCGDETSKNIAKAVDRLDYILLSHSHYDHIGALPYIKERFPEAVVCGSEKCSRILKKESAKALMHELGSAARELYAPQNGNDIRTDLPEVDIVLRDGDSVELGDETIEAYETKGHTDCSMSFFLKPVRLLFTSESTGILEGRDYIHTPVLKSFSDAYISLEKCRKLDPVYVCLPHFGMIPRDFTEKFFDMFENECHKKIDFVRSMKEQGLNEDKMFEKYIDRYWTPAKLQEQPYEAFLINSRHILNALLKEIDDV